MDAPRTLEEAKQYRYHKWAGNPEGNPYRLEDCAYEVWPADRMLFAYQCQRKNGYGPKGLYCKQHAKKVKELAE